jgi:hypothetical protein
MASRRRYIRTNWALRRDLPLSRLELPLTRAEVLAAEARWGNRMRAAWESQWSAIDTIARDLWRTRSSDASLRQRLWVALTFAVGNFKRQGNTAIHPLPAPWRLAPLRGGEIRRGEVLSIPTPGMTLTLTATGTTEHLAGMTRGLASVPTGSTLLTALWPDDNAIMDVRDFQVAVGLLAHQGTDIVAPDECASLYAPDWGEYQWFRSLLKSEAERLKLPSPIALERALYVGFDARPRDSGRMSWQHWGAALRAAWPR